jgi:hypothetical protein
MIYLFDILPYTIKKMKDRIRIESCLHEGVLLLQLDV